MSKIDSLLESYQSYIKIPWRDAAAMQRVIFCVYSEKDELQLRAKIEEFELVTNQSGYQWQLYDLTDTFAQWLSSHKYAESYYKNPKLLNTIIPNYSNYLIDSIYACTEAKKTDENTVFALQGVGSLFGLLKVKNLIEKIAPMIKGRLLIFFPGSYENNNYRLLDGYDGWNYLAVPITADKEL